MKKLTYIIACSLFLIVTCKEKTPEPTLENSDYDGPTRIAILTNSFSNNSISGFAKIGTTISFNIRAQSKQGILIIKTDFEDNNGNILSGSSNDINNYSSVTKNFSNQNITDYTSSVILRIPVITLDSIRLKATLITKNEETLSTYFTIYLKKGEMRIYLNDESVKSDSVTFLKTEIKDRLEIYAFYKSDAIVESYRVDVFKNATKKSITGFPKNFNMNQNYSTSFSVTLLDTGNYTVRVSAKNLLGQTDTFNLAVSAYPPSLYRTASISLGDQNNNALGTAFGLGSSSLISLDYKELKDSYYRPVASYIYDNSPYLISLYERKNSNLFADSINTNSNKTYFKTLELPVSSFDTISENFIYSMPISESDSQKVAISTSKLVSYLDSYKNRGVIKINSITVSTAGSVNLSIKRYQN